MDTSKHFLDDLIQCKNNENSCWIYCVGNKDKKKIQAG